MLWPLFMEFMSVCMISVCCLLLACLVVYLVTGQGYVKALCNCNNVSIIELQYDILFYWGVDCGDACNGPKHRNVSTFSVHGP